MRPFVFALAVLGVALLLIRPTGDFPINDDWQYAHVTKRFAETGSFVIDVPIAPALIGQAALGGLWIKAVGFSHFHMRILTILVSLLFLFLFDRILVTLLVAEWPRGIALLTLVLNPFFLHFTTSYMTEVFGYSPMLLGVLLWLGDKTPIASVTPRRVFASFVIGLSFWVRQFCAIALPALLIAALWPERHRWKIHLRSAVTYSLVFFFPIVAFIAWSHASGNVTEAAADPLRSLVRVNTVPLFYQGAILLIYSATFFLPQFVGHLTLEGITRRRLTIATLWIGGGVLYCFVQGFPATGISQHLHRFFPFSTNIINPHGLGPLTLTDAYYKEIGPPINVAPWAILGYLLSGLTVWALASPRITKIHPLFTRFYLIFSALTGYVVVMAFRKQVFDRYYFGIMLMMIPQLATLTPVRGRLKQTLAMIVLGAYSIIGTHDYFRWQETRWQLVDNALKRGITPTDLDGGYEVNGWHSVERKLGPDDNVADPYFRPQRPFAIVITPAMGDRLLAEIQPSQILFRLPAFKLVERRKS